ncbi:Transcription elongation regulator 1-like protein [Camelus dromedarius]|uniref:Transcription elongation regulator 1-like protein n=1 Tax=Camelus dromedarius TaxID=9838 RepID=A0A5N4DJC6_CAMDR|nr:Transcription elongation regulator 1-like protein [Camelus dromedarius]
MTSPDWRRHARSAHPVLTLDVPPGTGGGCHNSLKPVGNGPTIAIAAAAAMVSVDPEGLGGPAPSSVQPCHFLTLAPIKIPLRTAPFSAEGSPVAEGRLAPDGGSASCEKPWFTLYSCV